MAEPAANFLAYYSNNIYLSPTHFTLSSFIPLDALAITAGEMEADSSSHFPSQRRPALIPADVHLNTEDEKSVRARTGNAATLNHDPVMTVTMKDAGQFSAQEKRHAAANFASRSSNFLHPHVQLNNHGNSIERGKKRKASIAADEYHEAFNYPDVGTSMGSSDVDEAHGSQQSGSARENDFNFHAPQKSDDLDMMQHHSNEQQAQAPWDECQRNSLLAQDRRRWSSTSCISPRTSEFSQVRGM